MSKKWALIFSIIGTLLLVCIGAAISFHNAWLVWTSVVVAILFIGSGFVVKAKARNTQI